MVCQDLPGDCHLHHVWRSVLRSHGDHLAAHKGEAILEALETVGGTRLPHRLSTNNM